MIADIKNRTIEELEARLYPLVMATRRTDVLNDRVGLRRVIDEIEQIENELIRRKDKTRKKHRQ